MNRQQEFNNLLLELENTPEEMRHMSPRTKARAARRRVLYTAAAPFGVILAAMLMLTAIVNVSPAAAYAFERIPVIRQIAAAVNFSASLTDAIDHEFIQRIDLAQTIGDITMRVEYVIVDRRQLNIFYTLDSPIYAYLNSWRPSMLCAAQKTRLPASITTGSFTMETGAIRRVVVDFADEAMPADILFILDVVPAAATQMDAAVPFTSHADWVPTEPDNITTFTFTLSFDPYFTAQGEIFYINQDFEMDGQRFTLTSVEIYPTHMRVNFSADPANTAWLRSLRFHAENERGRRFDSITNGISAMGTTDSPMMGSHFLHSPFFAQSNALTLFISEVEWLDKDMHRVRLDLANATAGRLPEGVSLDEARRDGRSWHMSFAVEERAENQNHQIFTQNYFNEAGDAFHFTSWTSGLRYHASSPYYRPNIFFVQFALVDFPYDIVYLSPSHSRLVHLRDPVSIKIR